MPVLERLKMIFSEDEIKRISLAEENDSTLLIIVDVHGLTRHMAKRFINNLINIMHTDFNLIIIHGYNNGTAIKDMLQSDFTNPHVKNQYVDLNNPGRTHLQVA